MKRIILALILFIPAQILAESQHYKAESGEAFSSGATILSHKEKEKLINDGLAKLLPSEAALQDLAAKLEASAPKMDTSLPLSSCTRGRRDRERVLVPLEGEESLISDLLFVFRSEIPSDAEELFGGEATIIRIDNQNISAISTMARDRGASCFPFRLRRSTKALYRLEGKEALKHYEGVKQKGKLADYFKEKG